MDKEATLRMFGGRPYSTLYVKENVVSAINISGGDLFFRECIHNDVSVFATISHEPLANNGKCFRTVSSAILVMFYVAEGPTAGSSMN